METVKLSISGIFYGVCVTEEMLQSMVGKPIRDNCGTIIGEITEVRSEADEIIGVLYSDKAIKKFINSQSVSVEIAKGK